MESFGNYPREKFDPFSVMLFKGLQVVAFLFFIALLVMNPEAKSGKIDTKAEFLITATWPDSHPDDIDLYAEDPAGNIVWYHVREAGFMVLDRDDRGGLNNTISWPARRSRARSAGDGQHPRHRAGRVHRQRQPLSRHHRRAGAGFGEGREDQSRARGRALRHAAARSHRARADRGALASPTAATWSTSIIAKSR